MLIKTKFTASELVDFLTRYLFLIIFPGYLLYNILVLYSIIPPIFGGYFGLFSFLAFVFYFFYSFDLFKKSINSSLIFSIFGIGAFCIAALITALSYFYNNPGASQQSLELLIFWIAFYALGFYVTQIKENKNLTILNYFIYAFFAYALFYIISEGKLMLQFGTSEVENDAISGYQGIARNILVIGYIIIAFTEAKILMWVKIVIVAILLFLVGARSEFFAFLVAIVLTHSLLAFKLKSSFLAIFLVVCSAFLAIAPNLSTLSESRQMQVFDLSHSNSWQGRQQMKELALKQIHDSPFLGEFGGHTRFAGDAKTDIGAYAHNALSGYVNYGLVFFILYILFSLFSTLYSIIKLFKDPLNNYWRMSFLFTFTVMFLILTAKPVFWPITYLAWGIFMGCIYRMKFHSIKVD